MIKEIKPINPNTSHKNRHTLYLGGSGCGKSQAVISNPEIPCKGRIFLWDCSADHSGIHTESRRKFLILIKKNIYKKAFRLAYCGNTPEEFDWLCRVIWACLDGRYNTFFIVEELSHVCSSIAKATPHAARLLNQGRKYGLVFHGVSQKPQEISKTYFDQCERKYIGRFRGANAKRMASFLCGAVTAEDVEALKPLQFYYDSGDVNKPLTLKNLSYTKPKGVEWV